MKIKQYLIIIAIVVAIHLVFLLILRGGCKGHAPEENLTENVIEPAPGPVEEPDTPQDKTAPAQIAAAQPADPLAGVEPYSPQYFSKGLVALPPNIQKLTENCKSGVVVDLDGRRVLWEKDPDTPRQMASVTKIMTALVAIRKMRLSNGQITPDTMIQVTRTASKIGGRQVWLDPREKFSFTEIMKCIMVHSANDCAYLMAEFMGNGDADSFVADMNAQARQLGCRNFTFVNSHGLAADDGRENMGSPIELAYLASVVLGVPEITKWTCVKVEYIRENDEEFKKRNKGLPTMLSSSNSLLGRCNGVNGLKTGFTNNAGFCIVITCERNSRRVAVVIMGSPKAKVRDELGIALVNWAYQTINK
ncbi:MAG: D-alanyl-D-alanine carboxypeptidase [Victivallales bacterium]|nr:D-alanyl-D-alanine carboxypeptidase [Victivallales bacterium]